MLGGRRCKSGVSCYSPERGGGDDDDGLFRAGDDPPVAATATASSLRLPAPSAATTLLGAIVSGR